MLSTQLLCVTEQANVCARSRCPVARMTSTYERIHSESIHYRAHQRCEFISEFKDSRGLPPPLNLLSMWRLFVPRRRLARFLSANGQGHGLSVTIARCLMRLLKSADGGLARGFRVPMGKCAMRPCPMLVLMSHLSLHDIPTRSVSHCGSVAPVGAGALVG
jgi:hypothetical protein